MAGRSLLQGDIVVAGRPIRTPKIVFYMLFILTKTGGRTNNYFLDYFLDALSGPSLRTTPRNDRKKRFN